jgi:hypothetical protein
VARESREIPRSVRRVYSPSERWPRAYTAAAVVCRAKTASRARDFRQRPSFAFGVWQAEAAGIPIMRLCRDHALVVLSARCCVVGEMARRAS